MVGSYHAPLCVNVIYGFIAGNKIAGGTNDGSVHIWNYKRVFSSRADIVLPNASETVNASSGRTTGHAANSTITCISFSADGSMLVSRDNTGTIVLWDLKAFPARPTKKFQGCANVYPTSNVEFR